MVFPQMLHIIESSRPIESFLAETTVVPGTVEKLRQIYAAGSRASQAFFLGRRQFIYPVHISISNEGKLVAGLPLEIIREYFQAAPQWGILERLSHFCFDSFTLSDLIPPAPMIEGVTIIGSNTSWSADKGAAHERLNDLPPGTELQIWDPTTNEFVPVDVRPYRHAGGHVIPHQQGAIVLPPTGFAERIAEKVDVHLAKVRDYFVSEVLGGLERYL